MELDLDALMNNREALIEYIYDTTNRTDLVFGEMTRHKKWRYPFTAQSLCGFHPLTSIQGEDQNGQSVFVGKGVFGWLYLSVTIGSNAKSDLVLQMRLTFTLLQEGRYVSQRLHRCRRN